MANTNMSSGLRQSLIEPKPAKPGETVEPEGDKVSKVDKSSAKPDISKTSVEMKSLYETLTTLKSTECKYRPFKPIEFNFGQFSNRSVSGFAFHSHKNIMAYGMDDGQILLLDLNELKVYKTLEGHTSAVKSIDIMDNNLTESFYIISRSDDKTLRLWDLKNEKENLKIDTDDIKDYCVQFSNKKEFNLYNTFIASTSMKDINFYKVHGEFKLEFKLVGHEDNVISISFCNDNVHFASGSRDGQIVLWNLIHGTKISIYKIEKDALIRTLNLDFNYDGEYLAFGFSYSIPNIQNINKKLSLPFHEETKLFTFSPCANYFAYISSFYNQKASQHQSFLKIWNLKLNRLEFFTELSYYRIESLKFNENGNYLLCGFGNGFYLWDLFEYREEYSYKNEIKANIELQYDFSCDGNYLAYKILDENDNNIKIMHHNLYQQTTKILKLEGKNIHSKNSINKHFKYTEDGKFLSIYTEDGKLILYDIHKDSNSEEYSGNLDFCTLNKNLNTFATLTQEEICDLDSPKPLEIILNQRKKCEPLVAIKINNFANPETREQKIIYLNQINSPEIFVFAEQLELSSNGKYFAFKYFHGILKFIQKEMTVFNFKTPSYIQYPNFPDYIYSVVQIWSSEGIKVFETPQFDFHAKYFKFSLDEKYLIVVYEMNRIYNEREKIYFKVQVINILTKTINEYEIEGYMISDFITFSPDGRYFVCGFEYESQVINIRNINNCKVEMRFSVPINSYKVGCVQFSPDSLFLVSVSNCNIQLWNIIQKREECNILSQMSLNEIRFSNDGRFLIGLSISSNLENFGSLFVKYWNIEDIMNNTKPLTPLDAKSQLILTNDPKNLNPKYQQKDPPKLKNEPEIIKPQKEKIPIFYNTSLIPYLRFFDYCNALDCIKSNHYNNITNWNIIIFNNRYTPLHFAAYEGDIKNIETRLKSLEFLEFRSDYFGRSALFYSITAQHHLMTQTLLNYYIEKVQNAEEDYQLRSFMALTKDLPLIIKSSAKGLSSFLELLFYSRLVSPFFGSLLRPMLFDVFFTSNNSLFLDQTAEFQIPLKIKTTWLEFPSVSGSDESIELLSSILLCSNKDIYKTQVIQCFIQIRWNELWSWAFGFTVFIWADLICIVVVLDGSLSMFYLDLILLVFVNFVLMLWEIFQFTANWRQYFKDLWNFIDFIRFFCIVTWVILYHNDIKMIWLTWLVVIFSILRGLTGFRCFDATRYYVKLILDALSDIKYFLIIFIYTTMSFSLLILVSKGKEEISFAELWASTFEMTIGGNFESLGTFNFIYVSFTLAIVINVILMLNMIISILGDSFDRFQIDQVYFDYKERAEVILEIEQILSSFQNNFNVMKFIHVCENYYLENEIGEWEGKVTDIRQSIRQSEERINERFNQIEEKLDLLIRTNETACKSKEGLKQVEEEKVEDDKDSRFMKIYSNESIIGISLFNLTGNVLDACEISQSLVKKPPTLRGCKPRAKKIPDPEP